MIVDLITSHLDSTTVLIFLVVTLVTWLFLVNRGLPPGPWGLPFAGYLFLMSSGPAEVEFDKLSKKYGNVMSMKMGPYLFVVLGNWETIKEAYVKQGDNFSGRPTGILIKMYEEDTGVVTTDGDRWREHRRFILSTMRDYGMGKLSLEPKIMEEIHHFLAKLAQMNGKPYDFSLLLGMSTLNIICTMEFGRRFEYDDERFRRLRNLSDEVNELFGLFPIRSFYPWVATIKCLDRWTNESKFKESYDKSHDFYREFIEEHRKNYVDGSKDNLIDAFITEQKAVMEKTGSVGYFDDEELIGNLDILFQAGTETITTTLKTAILYAIKYPHIQKRIHDEIEEVIGMERAPTMADRNHMTYTDAFLLEVHRCLTVAPMNIFHSNIEEAQLGGYKIPKRSVILTNLWAVHNDPTLWKEPEKFMPERFINERGQITKPEYLVPFGLGKRMCLGESLAKMELFLYFTSMLQRFEFSSQDGVETTVEFDSTFLRRPRFRKVCAVQKPGYQVQYNL